MRIALTALVLGSWLLLAGVPVRASYEGDPPPPASVTSQPVLSTRVLAEKRVDSLPAGPLFWRLERFGTLPEAHEAAGAYTLTAADSGGGAWSASLDGSAAFTDPGPLAPVVASEYLLRITEVTGPRGSTGPVVTMPGSAAIYVLAGEMCLRTAGGVTRVATGASALAPAADTPMQASSCGGAALRALWLSVTDASRPDSSPARFPTAPARPTPPESPGYESPTNPY